MDGVCLIQHSAPKGIEGCPWAGEKKDSSNPYVSRSPLILMLIIASANASDMTSGLEVCGCWNFPGTFCKDNHCFCFPAFLYQRKRKGYILPLVIQIAHS